MIDIRIDGLAEVKKALEEVSTRVERRVVSEALAAGARVFALEVQKSTPVRQGGGAQKYSEGTRLPGFLKRTVWYFRQKRKVARGKVVWLAGPSEKGYYRHMVERGHIIGRRLKKGQPSWGRSFVPPHPFIEPAFNRSYGPALMVFKTEFEIAASDAIRKAGFRAQKA